jgi:hypothetical protein
LDAAGIIIITILDIEDNIKYTPDFRGFFIAIIKKTRLSAGLSVLNDYPVLEED